MDDKTRKALTNPSTWSKGAVMLLFFLMLAVVTPLLVLVSLVGWVGLLVSGRTPVQVSDFGRGLADWYVQTVRYLTGNASRRPFPFEDLDCPSDEPGSGKSAESFHREQQVGTAAAQPSGPAKDAPDPADAGPARAKRPARKKASGKKTSGKKTGRKKSSTRKASSKKAVSKKPAAPDVSADRDSDA